MKELVGKVELYNRFSKAFDEAGVFQELDQKNFDDFMLLWKPILDKRRSGIRTAAEAADANIQDAHWDWIDKAKVAATMLGQETFAVECGDTQGLMLVDLNGFGRLDAQKGRELVYVEFLATAPWNRYKTVPSPRYKGVGRVLVATALSLSIESGFHGRLGLHSLPQSEGWYRDVARFTDLGLDVPKHMHYFEITKEQAIAFLEVKQEH
jgi:hypothetical protein